MFYFKKSIEDLNLKLNNTKTKCIIFNSKFALNETTKLHNDVFEIVGSIKYLGNTLHYRFNDIYDVELRLNNFYKSFRTFTVINIQTFLFIFNLYCIPNYGLELWDIF